jgi:hypothetical protein
MIPTRNPDRELIIDPREFKFEPFEGVAEKDQFDQWAKRKLADAGFVMDRTGTEVVTPFHRKQFHDGRVLYRQWLPERKPVPDPKTACV